MGYWANLTVHTATSNYKELLGKIESIWHRDVPGVPFEYNFMDEQVQKQYESDISMSRIINAFTISSDLYFLSWIIRAGSFQCRTTK